MMTTVSIVLTIICVMPKVANKANTTKMKQSISTITYLIYNWQKYMHYVFHTGIPNSILYIALTDVRQVIKSHIWYCYNMQ